MFQCDTNFITQVKTATFKKISDVRSNDVRLRVTVKLKRDPHAYRRIQKEDGHPSNNRYFVDQGAHMYSNCSMELLNKIDTKIKEK